jgi:hypothetical protein
MVRSRLVRLAASLAPPLAALKVAALKVAAPKMAALAALTMAGCATGVGPAPADNVCGAEVDQGCCAPDAAPPVGVVVNGDGCAVGLTCDATTATCQTATMSPCGDENGVCCEEGATACNLADLQCIAGRCQRPDAAPELFTLRVSRTEGGTFSFTSSTCPASLDTCQGEFPMGQTVRMLAAPAPGFRVASWRGVEGCEARETCAVEMTRDYDVQVVFEERGDDATSGPRELRLSRTGEGAVETTDGHCDVRGESACTHAYAHGATVTLRATPGAGHRVRFWGVGSCDEGEPTCTLTMDRDRAVEVAFEPVTRVDHRLNISREDGGTFSVIGQSCPFRSCSPSYRAGETAVVIASPSAGYRVSAWSLSPSDVRCDAASTRCEIPMDRERDLHIEFESGSGAGSRRTLDVSRSSGGVFTVAGRSCPGSTCALGYGDGATATIHATPDPGFRVARWEGAPLCAANGTCNVLMDADKTVNVVFEPNTSGTTRQLIVSRTTGGTFLVQGYFCPGSTCTLSIPDGDRVTIDASPAAGYEVARWGGATGCGTSNRCTFTMSADRNVMLELQLVTTSGRHTLDVSRSAGGTVLIPGRSCPRSTCTQSYAAGATATITASPDSGLSIFAWEGAPHCGTSPSCAVTMDRDRTIRVVFQRTSSHRTLTVSRSSGGTFAVAGRSCPGSTCTLTYMNGDTATITATPSPGYVVLRWDGASACGTSRTCDVRMTSDRTVQVVFDTAPTGGWDVTVRTADVPARRADGTAWDSGGGAPDPFVEVAMFTSGSVTLITSANSEVVPDASGVVTFDDVTVTGFSEAELRNYIMVVSLRDSDGATSSQLMCNAGVHASSLIGGARHTVSCEDASGTRRGNVVLQLTR